MTRKTVPDVETTDEMEMWNREDASDLVRPQSLAAYNVVIAARDWTVETIVQQVREGNIDLDPDFQRRNAWRDDRRSRLIESFILGFPVPQIVLAENPHRRKSYIVIDGRQRLMTVAGFFLGDYRNYWSDAAFSGLKVLGHLNRLPIDTFLEDSSHSRERRELANADIRTTVLTGFRDEAVLYDIFYRINTGSVPLASQELRQVLHRGDFAKYLLDTTSQPNPIWSVLNIDAPDARLRDVELLLRLISWKRYADRYGGNLKQFLDDTMKDLNRDWAREHKRIDSTVSQLFLAVEFARKIYGSSIGRKYKDGSFERVFNRAVFEIQAYFFASSAVRAAAGRRKHEIVEAFKALSKSVRFTSAVESTTKSLDNTRARFELYRLMLQRVVGVQIPVTQIGPDEG